jgi:hypothetical protein
MLGASAMAYHTDPPYWRDAGWKEQISNGYDVRHVEQCQARVDMLSCAFPVGRCEWWCSIPSPLLPALWPGIRQYGLVLTSEFPRVKCE